MCIKKVELCQITDTVKIVGGGSQRKTTGQVFATCKL